MYDQLSEEELIVLAIDYTLKGVSIPKEIRDRLVPESLALIEGEVNAIQNGQEF